MTWSSDADFLVTDQGYIDEQAEDEFEEWLTESWREWESIALMDPIFFEDAE